MADKSWEQISKELRRPFPARAIGYKPGVITKDGLKALAFPYVDPRAVVERLDEVAGREWEFRFKVLSDNPKLWIVQGTLTILGITREDVGEGTPNSPTNNENVSKGAVSDSLKRAAVLFGVGAYIYKMPQVWLPYDAQKKKFSEEYPYDRAIKAMMSRATEAKA